MVLGGSLYVLLLVARPTVGVWKGSRQNTLDVYVPKWASAGAKVIGEFSVLFSLSPVLS